MATSLIGKLNSMQSNEVVKEINALLNKSHHVTISWWGERLVSIGGYEGSVEIDVIARKYLEANVFAKNLTASTAEELPSLQERLQCYNRGMQLKGCTMKVIGR